MITAWPMHLVVELIIAMNHKAGPGVDLQTLSVLPTCRDLDLIFAQVVSLAEQRDEPPAALVRPPTGQDGLLADLGNRWHGREKIAAPRRVFLQVILEVADRLLAKCNARASIISTTTQRPRWSDSRTCRASRP